MPRLLTDTDVETFRARLRDAAERLFLSLGREGVTMRQLAAELGCSPMTPYRYFKDKDAILASVRATAFTRFAETLEAAYAGAGPDAASRSLAVGQAYIDFALGQSDTYRLMFDLSQPSEAEFPDLVEARTRAVGSMTRHVQGMIDAGLLEGEAAVIGRVFWAGLHGLVTLELAGKLGEGFDFQTLRFKTLSALTRGFAPSFKAAA